MAGKSLASGRGRDLGEEAAIGMQWTVQHAGQPPLFAPKIRGATGLLKARRANVTSAFPLGKRARIRGRVEHTAESRHAAAR